MLAAIGVAMLGGIAVATTAQATQPDPNHKDYVCKYVGKPGVDERLQTGDNPIWVDTAATESGWFTGLFNDAQERSFVIVADTPKLDPEPGIDQCSAPNSVPVTPEASATVGTCEAAGQVTLVTKTGYSWSGNTGTANDPIYTATAATGYVLTGSGVFTFHGISQLTGEQCAGRVVLPTLSATRVCNAVGSVNAVNTEDFTWGFTGPDTARMYTATPIGDVVLVGTNPQGPFDVSAIPSQSTNPDGACFVPPTIVLTTVAALTFTPGTCLAVGSVVATETAAYSWVVTGPATARVYTAVAKAGYTLTGTTGFGPFNLSKIASQSTNPNGACYVALPVVAGIVADAPVVAGIVADAPVVAGIVQNAPAVGTLAFTGAETVPLGLSGLIVLVLGAVLTVAGRRQGGQRARE